MGSTAAKTTETKTTTVTTTNNNNVVQTVNRGTDAVALARALGDALAQNQMAIAAQQEAYAQAASDSLQTLASARVAQSSGGQLTTPSGAGTISSDAQLAGTITQPIIIAAAVVTLALFLKK